MDGVRLSIGVVERLWDSLRRTLLSIKQAVLLFEP